MLEVAAGTVGIDEVGREKSLGWTRWGIEDEDGSLTVLFEDGTLACGVAVGVESEGVRTHYYRLLEWDWRRSLLRKNLTVNGRITFSISGNLQLSEQWLMRSKKIWTH